MRYSAYMQLRAYVGNHVPSLICACYQSRTEASFGLASQLLTEGHHRAPLIGFPGVSFTIMHGASE